MIVKVCGMTEQQNLTDLLQLKPNWFGMIFYPASQRYMQNSSPRSDAGIKRIGVFVNASKEEIMSTTENYALDGIQLHGSETPLLCAELQEEDLLVIKAFSVNDDFDFDLTQPYEPHVDYFLFDTKGTMPGGNGILFNWDLMREYKGTIPFLLAGGIGVESAKSIRTFEHDRFAGIDINSRFEIAPGIKNIEKIKAFADELRS